MPINFRATGSIPDNSITSNKLADNAVTNSKIADDAVTTSKISDAAVTVGKVTSDITTQHFLGYETELTHTGTTETSIGEFNFTTNGATSNDAWKTLGYSLDLKSSNVGNTATVNIYLDSALILTTNTASTSYVVLDAEGYDLGAIADGKHLVEVKLVNSQVAETAYLGRLDVYLGKS